MAVSARHLQSIMLGHDGNGHPDKTAGKLPTVQLNAPETLPILMPFIFVIKIYKTP